MRVNLVLISYPQRALLLVLVHSAVVMSSAGQNQSLPEAGVFISGPSADGIVMSTLVDANSTLSISITAPPSLLSKCSNIRIQLADDDSRAFLFRPISEVRIPHFPAGRYLVDLRCDCKPADFCRYLPSPAVHLLLPGLERDSWNLTYSDVLQGQEGAGGGPLMLVTFNQHGHFRFRRMRVVYYGCDDGAMRSVTLADGEPLLLGADCGLQYNNTVFFTIHPETWFCEEHFLEESTLCWRFSHEFDLKLPSRPRRALLHTSRVSSLAPSAALVAGVAALLALALVSTTAFFLWRRRYQASFSGHVNEAADFSTEPSDTIVRPVSDLLSDDPVTTGSNQLAHSDGERLRVLLVYCADTSAETAAVDRLVSALRSRGADVTDQLSGRLGDAWLAEGGPVPAADRLLVLNSASSAAALVDAEQRRLSSRQRRFAKAVRLLSASALGQQYDRLCQARLGAHVQPVVGLAEGVVYTLPEDTQQLVETLYAVALPRSSDTITGPASATAVHPGRNTGSIPA